MSEQMPERIWAGSMEPRGRNYTWMPYQGVNGVDTEYIRADVAESQLAQAKAEIERLERMVADAYFAGADNAEYAFTEFGTFDDCMDFKEWKANYLRQKGGN